MESNYFTSDQHILDKVKRLKMKFLDDRALCNVGSVTLRFCHFYVQTSIAKYVFE